MFYLLGHMTSHIVEEEERVYPGKIVGYVGDTGNSSGAHLHLTVYKTAKSKSVEIFKNGNYEIHEGDVVNPFNHSIDRRKK